MIDSGERLDLRGLSRPTVDKHSTGGVGDKVSLILAPLVAACGAAVPQLSGRGLGHTGGTLDKLESIPGWRATLSNDEIREQLERVGAVICAAGVGLAPRRPQALRAARRDRAPSSSIPLISSSIMSKKIAEGTEALVLDVKVGSGAFIKDVDARSRARPHHGGPRRRARRQDRGAVSRRWTRRSAARSATRSKSPRPSTSCRGRGPATFASSRSTSRGSCSNSSASRPIPATALDDGSALRGLPRDDRRPGRRPRRRARGGATPRGRRRSARRVRAPTRRVAVGVAAWRLGAGRARRKDDPVSATAGVRLSRA